MRNLKLICRESTSIPVTESIYKFIQCSDNPKELILCHGLEISKFDSQTNQICQIFNIANEVPSVKEDDIVDIIFLSMQRSLCLFLRHGEIFIINIETLEVNIPDTNFYQQEIKSVKLSPDQELIVVVTNDLQVFLLDYLLGVIINSKLYDESFGEREFITVGWGKKETQFHGSEGKEAAKIKPKFDTDVQYNNDNCLISWRGDGMLFLVGFVLNSQSMFKVFNREGVLQFTSEKQPGLECNFTWRPSGNLIATTQILPNKYIITFFEKNGLKHGEFQLPLKHTEIYIKKLSWSEDSEVLSVQFEHKVTMKTHILLYTVNNYNWYLKQSCIFPIGSKVLATQWDDNSIECSGKLLHLISENGAYEKLRWVWDVDQSNGKDLNDDATVGVINGNKILLTSFRKSVVPPPMAMYTIQFHNNINRVVFGPNTNKTDSAIDTNSFFVITEEGSMHMYSKDKNLYSLIGVSDVFVDINASMITNVLWVSDNRIIFLVSNNSLTDVYTVNISYDQLNKLTMTVDNKVEMKEQIIGIRSIESKDSALLQNSSGNLILIGPRNGDSVRSFPECCNKFDVICIEDEMLPIGLTNRNRFYIEDVKVANNINSYFIHSDFLLLTTLQHQLLTCPLKKKDIMNLQNNANSQNQQDSFFANRRIERGATLVTTVSFDSRTVLQMPRGNIEIIQPRTLSLNIIGKYLNNFEYKPAFDLMRKQRINLNLIYDHNPKEFLIHIDDFITQINNSQWISLFISELEQQDITKTMYVTTYKDRSNQANDSDKVKLICEHLRRSLESSNKDNKNFLPIITTYVKGGKTSDLECALKKIKKVKDEEVSNGVKYIVSADDALKYLLIMVNVDELYNIALGLYDYNLVMFVAVKSQKDPKEYVPYLNKLKNMNNDYAMFSIDNDLKRYESALKHLIACKEDRGEELTAFVKQHNLYNSALISLSKEDARYKTIAASYGNYLMGRQHFKEAGIMFRRSDNIEKALECFVEALEWQSALFMAHELNYTQEQSLDLEKSLLDKLKEAGLYSEALCLLQNSDNYQEKVSCAIDGRLFKQSLSICLQHQRFNLIDELITPAVMEQFESILTSLTNNESQFIAQKDRLLIVRQNKLAIKKNFGDDENMLADCDLYSDTSSIMGSTSSKSSGRTFRSSKNRRKHERKMVSLKEGSRYEDIALMRALHILVMATFNLRKDVSDMVYVLSWLERDVEAMKLQNILQTLINNMTFAFMEIWPSDTANTNKPIESHNPIDNTDGVNSLEPHMRIPPIIQEVKWKLETL